MIAIPKRVVLQGLTIPTCVEVIRENAAQTLKVDFMDCCVKKISPCMAQSADKTFSFQDADTVDYSLATEITFDIWQGIGGVSLYSGSLTGGEITLVNDYTFSLTIDNTDSSTFPKGNQHCEAWVTLSGGERRCVGSGPFQVIDTRKYD